ncbi:MAG: hypothetical protein ACHQ9S_27495, partial [Candidatus Binatia bacterium]
ASDAAAEVRAAATSLLARIDTVAGNATPRPGPGGFAGRRGGAAAPPNFVLINGNLGRQLNGQDLADQAPTEATLAAFAGACEDLRTAVTSWNAIREQGLAGFNAAGATHNMAELTASGSALPAPQCAARSLGGSRGPRGNRGR